jgi:hypothetical protein
VEWNHYGIKMEAYLHKFDRSVGSPGVPVSSTNKTDHQDIAEILLKVALNTITLTHITYLKKK